MFEELLDLDKSFTIRHRNLQRLAIEMYKIKNNVFPIDQFTVKITSWVIRTNIRGFK